MPWIMFRFLGLLGLSVILSPACSPFKMTKGETSTEEAGPAVGVSDVVAREKAVCPDGKIRVIGGSPSEPNSEVASHTVKIWIKNQRYCTGTLIGPRHIVSAAHCFRDQVGPDELRLGLGIQGTPVEALRVSAYKIHQGYGGIPNQVTPTPSVPLNDVAVLVFNGELPTTAQAVGIAKPTNLYRGLPVIVSGYGAYASTDKQRRPLSQVNLTLDEIFPNQREIQLKRGEQKGACFGDSGGPTFMAAENDACLLLIGSTTGPGRNTDGTCESGGGTMMDLTQFRSWMRCAFESMGTPLASLAADRSESCL